jgi:hypothetical protein
MGITSDKVIDADIMKTKKDLSDPWGNSKMEQYFVDSLRGYIKHLRLSFQA